MGKVVYTVILADIIDSIPKNFFKPVRHILVDQLLHILCIGSDKQANECFHLHFLKKLYTREKKTVKIKKQEVILDCWKEYYC